MVVVEDDTDARGGRGGAETLSTLLDVPSLLF